MKASNYNRIAEFFEFFTCEDEHGIPRLNTHPHHVYEWIEENLEEYAEEYANQRVIKELEKFILYKQKLEQMFDSEQVVALAVVEELDKKYKELKHTQSPKAIM